jgi:hypothetical protein
MLIVNFRLNSIETPLYTSPDPYQRINEKIKELETLLPLVSDLLIDTTDGIRLEDGLLVVPVFMPMKRLTQPSS